MSEVDSQRATAELDEKLAGASTVLDAMVRELADAHNQMMQVPNGAGEGYSQKYLVALHHVMAARSALRTGS